MGYYSLYVGSVMKKNSSTDAEDSLVYSPLCQRITRDGTEVDIQIYNDDKGGWLLEVVDEFWKLAIYLTPPTPTGSGLTSFANGIGSI